MKLERKLRRRSGNLVFELTPLIDVVFLLLIFFLVATTTEDLRSGIKIELPQSSAREVTNIKELQVIIAENRELYISYKENDNSVQLKVDKDDLMDELRIKMVESGNSNVLISADKRLDYGYVVEIMNIAREGGATSLDIDTAEIQVSE